MIESVRRSQKVLDEVNDVAHATHMTLEADPPICRDTSQVASIFAPEVLEIVVISLLRSFL